MSIEVVHMISQESILQIITAQGLLGEVHHTHGLCTHCNSRFRILLGLIVYFNAPSLIRLEPLALLHSRGFLFLLQREFSHSVTLWHDDGKPFSFLLKQKHQSHKHACNERCLKINARALMLKKRWIWSCGKEFVILPIQRFLKVTKIPRNLSRVLPRVLPRCFWSIFVLRVFRMFAKKAGGVVLCSRVLCCVMWKNLCRGNYWL